MKVTQQLIRKLTSIPNNRSKINEAQLNFVLLCISNIYDVEDPISFLRPEKTNKKESVRDRREARIIFFYLAKMSTGLSYDKLVLELQKILSIKIHKRSLQTGFEFIHKIKRAKQKNDLVVCCEQIQTRLDKYIRIWEPIQNQEDLSQS
jgi:hypothetical protein